MEATRGTAALPKKDAAERTLKRRRDGEYTDSYPLLPREAKALSLELRHLCPALCSGFFAHSKYGRLQHPRCRFAVDKPPVIVTVVSSVHPARSNEDGELLLSPLDTFRNCISSTTWDPRDEYLIASKRSGFQLFSTSSWLTFGNGLSETSKPVLELKSAIVQARLGGENRISFGLLVTQFLGSTLHTICGYSGTPQLDIFDLEDLDEATGLPLRTYNLRSLRFDSCSRPVGDISATTAVVTVSDTVAVAALSNGCSALIDVRTASPVLCTETPPPPAILSVCNPGTRRVAQGTAITAVEVADRSNCVQLLTGTKDGMIVLWDLRKRNEPVAVSSLGGEIQALHATDPSSSCRCGAPTVWLNTDSGDIVRLSIGASSFEEVTRVSTSDSQRTQLSATLSPPKFSVMPLFNLLIYPHISSNRLLFYDIGCGIHATEDHSAVGFAKCGTGTQKNIQSALVNDFMGTRSHFSEYESDDDCALLSSDLQKSTAPVSLLLSCPFSDWSYQICSVSASNKHSTVCIGGDDGDLHVLCDSIL
ncbi:hypothetical protein NXY56_008135 [Leishmania guyanensis]